jgi:hypothetical protein
MHVGFGEREDRQHAVCEVAFVSRTHSSKMKMWQDVGGLYGQVGLTCPPILDANASVYRRIYRGY